MTYDQKNDPDDIGGTAKNIARGTKLSSSSAAVAKRKTLQKTKVNTATPEEKARIQNYLHHGPTAEYNNKKRRQDLKFDDQQLDMTLNDSHQHNNSKLTPHQQRALTKRKRMGDRVIKANIDRMETKRLEAAIAATDAEVVLHTEQSGFIETETEMERTYKMTQGQLKQHLDEQTARHIYDLNLDQYSPYGMNYDRSGRCGILYGKNGGHVALMDMHTLSLKTEFHLQEKLRSAVFLHNTTLFAVAQQKHVFIYDDSGVQIHHLTEHQDIFQMEFLPHHWLLSTIGRTGYLKYQDTSTGELVSTHRTKLGACYVMTLNKSNAIIHCGHLNGVVTLWSPANSEYLVKMLCHKGGPVHSLAVDQSGRYMVTGGADSQIKIWDLRMYKETHAYFSRGGAPTSMDISQKGVLGIGHGSHTTFWSPDAIKYKVKDPYMGHFLNGKGPVESLRFRPFEDICGIGHAKGFSSIVIPGSGEPNLDSLEYNTNPFQDTKQRREAEVRALLDKLNPNMIALDPDVIATVEESDLHRVAERKQQLEEEANKKKELQGEEKPKEKKRMRGKSKIKKKLARKHKNIIDANVLKLKDAIEKEKAEKVALKTGVSEKSETAPIALKRFFK